LWNKTGLHLSETRTVSIDQVPYGPVKCFVAAIECSGAEERFGDAWNNLGSSLLNQGLNEEGTSARVHDQSYSAKECFAEALRRDFGNAYAWTNLGLALDANETCCVSFTADMRERDGTAPVVEATLRNVTNGDVQVWRRVDQARCFNYAVLLDPMNDVAWAHMGGTLNMNDRVDMHAIAQDLGVSWPTSAPAVVDSLSCHLQAVTLQPHRAAWLVNLGATLMQTGSRKVVVGQIAFSPGDCFTRALTSEPTCAAAWLNLGKWLSNCGRSSATLGTDDVGCQLVVSPQGCFERATQHDPESASAWFSLGQCLLSRDRQSAAGCFTRCLALSRDHAGARELLVMCESDVAPAAGNRRAAGFNQPTTSSVQLCL
jgi:tetratricopeptide (TPR) repeat protein